MALRERERERGRVVRRQSHPWGGYSWLTCHPVHAGTTKLPAAEQPLGCAGGPPHTYVGVTEHSKLPVPRHTDAGTNPRVSDLRRAGKAA